MKELFKKFFDIIARFLTPIRLGVVTVLVLFCCLLVLGDQGIVQLKRLVTMKNGLTQERQKLNEEIDTLTRRKQILSNPANLEMEVRSELGYIRPGEIVFEEKETETKMPVKSVE